MYYIVTMTNMRNQINTAVSGQNGHCFFAFFAVLTSFNTPALKVDELRCALSI